MLRKILLVEDNPDDEALTLRALKKSGFEVQVDVARDGREAIDYMLDDLRTAEHCESGMPDLVFLDLKLPFLNGLEVLEKLKNDPRTRLVPIVVLTSSKEEEDVLQSYSLGANSYVRKRINSVEFESALKDILAYWFEFIKLPPR